MENQPFVVLRHHFLTSNILHLYSEGPAKLDGVLKSEFEVLWKMLYSLYVHFAIHVSTFDLELEFDHRLIQTQKRALAR